MSGGTSAAVAALRRTLGGRPLIWFGIRGEDGESLLQLPELEASFSITAPLRSASMAPERNVCLELLSGVRPDLDRYDLDVGVDEPTRAFRRRLIEEVSRRCVLSTYRPTALTSALGFAMGSTMTLAGMHHDRQAAFEHKPWVESELARKGIRGLGWTYIADEHRERAKRFLVDGPHILRPSRTSGGVGIAHVATEADVDQHWPQQTDTFVAISPFLEPSVPLNFSGCVFDDGSIRLHPASIQLIGVPSCTGRRFGYCGNDFGAARDLECHVFGELEELGTRVGRWLHSERYRGAFGIDALLHDGRVCFIEVNARFQGSSAMSAEIAADAGIPDIFLDHLAATLGLPPADAGATMTEWSRMQPAIAHVVLHNLTDAIVRRDMAHALPDLPREFGLAQLASAVGVDPGGALCRLIVRRSVTATGSELDPATAGVATALKSVFHAG
jgi:hypothetical protein